MINQVKQLLKQRGIEYAELANGGVRFTYRDHAIEIYEQPVVCDGLVFAYNSDPPEEDCWEFVKSFEEPSRGTAVEGIASYLDNPEQLWGW